MKLRILLPILLSVAAVRAADPAPVDAVAAPAPTRVATLAELEALPQKKPGEAEYWSWAALATAQALQLIETNTLASGDEFFRVSKFVLFAESDFRTSRVRYELLLSAAARGQAEAESLLAGAWDDLVRALGRPLRLDFNGLAARFPEFYSVAPAPACVQAVLRDPAKARAAAAAAAPNAEIKQIVTADQADRRSDWSKLTKEERDAIGERDRARNARAREIIAAGELHTAADFAQAALVMQHSPRFEGFQAAHELAVCALLLGDRGTGRWLVAATYDRMLGSVGHDQRFATQYSGRGGGPSTLSRVDTAGICDAERAALGCPTLESARNRNLRGARRAEEASQLVKQFLGPGRTLRDPKFGLAATYPENWTLDSVVRWGDQQNTLSLHAKDEDEAHLNLYYRVYHAPKPRTPEETTAYIREEVRKKQEVRRQTVADYTNRPDSFREYKIGEYAAFSWLADFTDENGAKCVEYFVRLQTENADASFFVPMPAGRFEALRPQIDAFMATVKMPGVAP
jgi:hypothetical protein